MSLECRKCSKKFDGLTNGLCNPCIKTSSFMEFWDIKDAEEATRLYFLQEINKLKIQNNRDNGRKDGEGINEDEPLPKDLEELLKNDGSWEEIKQYVSQIPKSKPNVASILE